MICFPSREAPTQIERYSKMIITTTILALVTACNPADQNWALLDTCNEAQDPGSCDALEFSCEHNDMYWHGYTNRSGTAWTYGFCGSCDATNSCTPESPDWTEQNYCNDNNWVVFGSCDNFECADHLVLWCHSPGLDNWCEEMSCGSCG